MRERPIAGLIVAARCVRDDMRRHARETAPKTHPELRRYRDAGASGVALFGFPECDIGSDAFFMTELMADYSQGVVLEGDNPLGYVDLAVFVAPPPAADERLFVRRTRDRAREQRGRVDAIERLLREPDGVAELLGEIVGGPIVEFARKSPKLMEDTRANLLAVVNVRHDSERGAGEQHAADLVRLRKEEKLFNDVLGFRGSRTPIAAVVANLAQPADPGRRKALARVRRAFRSKAR